MSDSKIIQSAEEFAALLDDPPDGQRVAHMCASVEIWLQIIEDYPELRFDVAHNKTVPVEILAVLSNDPSDRVRSMVSCKRKLPRDILAKMVADSSEGVRRNVARHRHSDSEILSLLIDDECDDVSNIARERLGLPPCGNNE